MSGRSVIGHLRGIAWFWASRAATLFIRRRSTSSTQRSPGTLTACLLSAVDPLVGSTCLWELPSGDLSSYLITVRL